MNALTLVLGILLVAEPTFAQASGSAKPVMVQVRPLPTEAVSLQARLAPKMAPTARLKIQGAAMKVTSQPAANSNEMLAHARAAAWEAFPSLRSTDVDVATYLVMMQAATDAQNDLAATMQQMQATNSQKQAQRGAASTAKSGDGSAKKDSLGDMSQEIQMKLQMEQEQYSQCMEAVSNIMKKVSDTASSIVQNMK